MYSVHSNEVVRYVMHSAYATIQYTWSNEFRKFFFFFLVENVRSTVEVKTDNVANNLKIQFYLEKIQNHIYYMLQ